MAQFFKLVNSQSKTIAFVSQVFIKNNAIKFMKGYCYNSAFSNFSAKKNKEESSDSLTRVTIGDAESNILNRSAFFNPGKRDKIVKQRLNNSDIYSFMYYSSDFLMRTEEDNNNCAPFLLRVPLKDVIEKIIEALRNDGKINEDLSDNGLSEIFRNGRCWGKIRNVLNQHFSNNDQLFNIIRKSVKFPILKEWMPYCMDEIFLTPLDSYYADLNDPDNIYIVSGSIIPNRIKNRISRGLAEGSISINGSNAVSDAFTDVGTLTEYLEKFSDKLIKKTADNFTPLFNPKTEKFTRNAEDYFSFCNQIGKINLFNAQKNVINAVSKALNKDNATLIVGEMGVGKTALSIASAYINCKKKNPNNIIMCPGHLVEKWKREVERMYPGAKAVIIDSFSVLMSIEKEIKNKARQYPLFIIISKDTAKINYVERPAVIYDKKRQRFLCPHCGETIIPSDITCSDYKIFAPNASPSIHNMHMIPLKKPVVRITKKMYSIFANKTSYNSKCTSRRDFVRLDKNNCASKFAKTNTFVKSHSTYCSCGESLWTATNNKETAKWKKYGDAGYIHDDMIEDIKTEYEHTVVNGNKPIPFLKKAYNAIMKAEEYGLNTVAPRRYSIARYIKKKYKSLIDYFIADEVHLYSSSTSAQANAFGDFTSTAKKTIALTGTLLNGYANGIYYILFRMFPKDFTESGYGYGDVNKFAKEYGVEKITTVTNINNYHTKKSTKICPGVSPELFTKFLLDKAIFVSLSDMSTGLPKYKETIIPVKMSEPVRMAYSEILTNVRNYISTCNDSAKKAAVSFGAAQKLSLYPDQPFEMSSILDPDDYSKNLIEFKDVIKKEDRKNYYSEKDLKVLELVQEKIAKGENVLIYLSFVNKTNCMERLESMFKMAKIKACSLTSSVSSKNREEWIDKKVRAGYKVLICNPSLVETGLDLLSFTNIIFYQVGYNLFTMRQASRRSLRLNQPNNVNVYFMYYENTAQEIVLSLMANKLQASMAIEGKFSEEGLSAMSNNDSILTRLANSLVEDIEYKIEEGAFSSGLEAEEDDGTRFKMVYILDKTKNTKYSYFIHSSQKKNSKVIPFDKIRNVLMG